MLVCIRLYQPRLGVECCYVDSTMMRLVPGRVAAEWRETLVTVGSRGS